VVRRAGFTATLLVLGLVLRPPDILLPAAAR
jgi:hypothetical protein